MIKFIDKKKSPYNSLEIEQLINEIRDKNTEHLDVLNEFKKAMNRFATERSLDSSIDALNTCMQIAKIREQLLNSYKHYSKLLEKEILEISNHGNNNI